MRILLWRRRARIDDRLVSPQLDAELAVIDFDRVESKNLLAQAFTRQASGKNKAQALQLRLKSFFGKNIDAYGVCLGEDTLEALCGSADLLVDAFDNAAGRRLLSRFAKTTGKPLVHVAMSADLPFIGVLGASLARVIQDLADGGVRRDVIVDLRSVREP